mmetsp:Transcript_26833/g.69574  ORF Transcript_26833/g.69574 Transcript_26833/m.69574 type:complete len:207 (+) Transcript_26833:431-1051(+)
MRTSAVTLRARWWKPTCAPHSMAWVSRPPMPPCTNSCGRRTPTATAGYPSRSSAPSCSLRPAGCRRICLTTGADAPPSTSGRTCAAWTSTWTAAPPPSRWWRAASRARCRAPPPRQWTASRRCCRPTRAAPRASASRRACAPSTGRAAGAPFGWATASTCSRSRQRRGPSFCATTCSSASCALTRRSRRWGSGSRWVRWPGRSRRR